MAKRLSKALRAKRRWVGLAVPAGLSRHELKARISEFAPAEIWKIMDYEGARAILRIHLSDAPAWREVLADEAAPIHSLTMSGKIRLVRERLGLS